jgi:RHS repeat-associated protein
MSVGGWPIRVRCMSSLILAIGVLFTSIAFGQMAPTGSHYAAREADTGHGSAQVNSSGAYVVGVPLDLPAARGGLPIPLSVVHDGRGFGAAGLDWDVPLYFLRRDRTLAHRRPAFGANALPSARERITVSLPGKVLDLVKSGANWVPLDESPGVLVRELPGGNWSVEDGTGRLFRFSQPEPLRNAGLWLLKSIISSGNVEAELGYQLVPWGIDGATTVELNLTSISYNRHPLGQCFKNRIQLEYGTAAAQPLSLAMFGEVPIIRKRTLTRIDVSGRAGCAEAQPERLRRYTLVYGSDADTRLPRLKSVKVSGRQGSPEENVSLPLGSYEYGSATRAGIPNFTRVLRYARTQTIALPAQVDPIKLSGTAIEPVSGDPGPRYTMWQTLLDVTGDGRPELVFKQNGKLWMAYNRPAANGSTTLGVLQGSVGVRELADATFGSKPLSMHIASSKRYSYSGHNTVDVWRDAIDVNGDGLMDVIDAREMANAWVVYLNTPGGPTGVVWQRRLLSTVSLVAQLQSRGHQITDNRVPLSRRSSGRNVKAAVCWQWNDAAGTWTAAPLNRCQGNPMDSLVTDEELVERTYVEWEVNDLNGDGYPDFTFNSTPVASRSVPTEAPTNQLDEGTRRMLRTNPFVKREAVFPFGPAQGNGVRANFNMAGVRFSSDLAPPFARDVNLQVSSSNLGVGAWTTVTNSPTSSSQHLIAGFADVNGDGLMDRVLPSRAHLGAYHGTARFFSAISITLPGPAAIQRNEQPESCPLSDTTQFPSETVAGLRDLTGDGIPDYFNRDTVRIGTGTSFGQPIPIQGAPRGFSLQQETCDGDVSNTTRGLFDIDGDGKPEMLVLEGHAIAVYQLTGGAQPRSPEAGRLVAIDNGYGAKTRLTYVSAKEDEYGGHQIPAPEIVVSSVTTTGTDGTPSESRFAYGDARMIFDSQRDRFYFPGYLKHVKLRLDADRGRPYGLATVSNAWPLLPFNPAVSHAERWLRTQRVGLPRDIMKLRGSAETNPWRLLGVTHYDWGGKPFVEPAPQGVHRRDCVEMTSAYDFSQSSATTPPDFDVCRVRGHVFQLQRETWRGSQAPPSTSNVQTRWRALEVDHFGRTTFARFENDVRRSDDDVCVETKYAAHTGNTARKLDAVATQRVTDCARRITFGAQSWIYDGLPEGQVGRGRVTSSTLDRRATDNGAALGTIKAFDAEHDALGNVVALRSTRGPHTRTLRMSYDPFALTPLSQRVEATGAPVMTRATERDPVTLEILSETDVGGTERGVVLDGFDRPIRTTLRPPGGQLGIMRTVAYRGFEGGAQGRRIAVEDFADPIAPSQLAGAQGVNSVTFLDALGRPVRTETSLGGDYQNATLVTEATRYDRLGRIAFVADAHLAGSTAPYGTTYHFDRAGELDCMIRGTGPQPLDRTTDRAAERFPTCFTRLTLNGTEIVEIRDAASLTAGTLQTDTVQRVVSSAIGRELERSTVKLGSRLDLATFAYDRLGNRKTLTRYLDPVAATGASSLFWRWDSMGQVLAFTQPDAAPRAFAYSDWGELTESQWTDGATVRKISNEHDALGRVTAVREFAGTIEDEEARLTYRYDVAVALSTLVSPTFTLGRLSGAQFASGQIAFSYDAFGNTTARVHTDRDGTAYIERPSSSANGQLMSLEFNLPDQAYASEIAKYDYDSARRLRAINYSDPAGTHPLYRAATIDALGRIRSARFGQSTIYQAAYAAAGRRLQTAVEARSPLGTRRWANFAYDALGRQVVRSEIKDSAATRTTGVVYDSLDRVAGALRIDGTTVTHQITFQYDALGNLLEQNDVLGTDDVVATYGTGSSNNRDLDRLCTVTYGPSPIATPSCTLGYDASGNTVSQPIRGGGRRLQYFNSGAVRSIVQETNGSTAPPVTARFAYDAFGGVRELDVQGVDATGGARIDRRFGAAIETRTASSGAALILRNVPGPGGSVASKRGLDGGWVFAFGDQRGARFFTDQEGRFVQDVEYSPFGAASSSGAAAGSLEHSTQQWNGSDTLSAFGLTHLGARLHDPAIGRFLSRDPLIRPRGGTTTNAYAFAHNDPFNLSDPSGLDVEEPSIDPLANEPRVPWIPFGQESGYLKLGMWMVGGAFNSHYHPPTFLSGYSHVYKGLDALQSWMNYWNKPTGENKGYLIVSSLKAGSAYFGFWGQTVSTGLDLGLVFHRRGWGWTPFTNAENHQDAVDRMAFKAHLMSQDLKEILRELRLQEQAFVDATTCREEFVCRREGDEVLYEPPVSELPFGPMLIPVSPPTPTSPVQPVTPPQSSPGSFQNPLGGVDWGTISITETPNGGDLP